MDKEDVERKRAIFFSCFGNRALWHNLFSLKKKISQESEVKIKLAVALGWSLLAFCPLSQIILCPLKKKWMRPNPAKHQPPGTERQTRRQISQQGVTVTQWGSAEVPDECAKLDQERVLFLGTGLRGLNGSSLALPHVHYTSPIRQWLLRSAPGRGLSSHWSPRNNSVRGSSLMALRKTRNDGRDTEPWTTLQFLSEYFFSEQTCLSGGLHL